MSDHNALPLWSPTPEWISQTRVDQFRRHVVPSADDSQDLWRWSVEHPGDFWRAVWDFAEVVGDPGERLVEEAEKFWDWRFLPDAVLNVAESLLAPRAGAAGLGWVSRCRRRAQARCNLQCFL